MKLFRLAGVTCVAAAGLLAGWWAKEAAAQVPAPPPPTIPDVKPIDPQPAPLPVPAPQPLPPVGTPEDLMPKPQPPVDSMPHIGPFPAPQPQPIPAPLPPPVAPAKPPAPPVQYVNKPDLEFEYAVGTKGKSGVKDVRLLVRDAALVGKPEVPQLPPVSGTTAKPRPTGHWTEADAAAAGDEKTPKLRYTLPAEGKYDFRLRVTANNGNAAEVKDSDPPDLTVVFDTTPPVIEEFTATVGGRVGETQLTDSQLAIRWKVTDANLDLATPPVLEYLDRGSGRWSPFQNKPVPGLGGVRVADLPPDAPAELSLRITVTDKAGNVATKTIERLNLDTTIPDGKLTRVRAVEVKKKDEPLPPPDFDPKK